MAETITHRDRLAAMILLRIDLLSIRIGDDAALEYVEKATVPPDLGEGPRHVLETTAQAFAEARRDERQALEACLLFFKGGAWTARDSKRWHELVGNHDQTSRSLCDKIREVLGIPPREGEPR